MSCVQRYWSLYVYFFFFFYPERATTEAKLYIAGHFKNNAFDVCAFSYIALFSECTLCSCIIKQYHMSKCAVKLNIGEYWPWLSCRHEPTGVSQSKWYFGHNMFVSLGEIYPTEATHTLLHIS